MVAGAFDKEIVIWRPVQTTTDGKVTTTPAEVAAVWAAVMPQSGREYYRSKQTHATMTHLVRIYWSPEVADVTAKYWLTLGSRRLDIVSATNVDEASQFIDLVCVEKVE
jgi:SPP1 family predicted phage head-tail adaptor